MTGCEKALVQEQIKMVSKDIKKSTRNKFKWPETFGKHTKFLEMRER